MKKFFRILTILVLLLLILALGLFLAAGTEKGREAIIGAVEKVTGGRVTVNLDSLSDWSLFLQEQVSDSLESVDYDIQDAMNFDSRYEIQKGNIEKYELESSIRNLKIEVGGCTFRAESSGDDRFYLEAEEAGKLQAYVENDTLYLRATAGSRSWNELSGSKIILYVPEDYVYQNVEISLGAGLLQFDNLKTGVAILDVGAGSLQLSCMAVGNGVSLSCAMGNIDVSVLGKETDFNYELSSSMGNLDLGTKRYSGMGVKKSIDNGAEKTLEVECSMGNISICFTEDEGAL